MPSRPKGLKENKMNKCISRKLATVAGMFAALSALLTAAEAGAVCRTLPGQSGVPFTTTDWNAGAWRYNYNRVELVGTTAKYWQIPLPIDGAPTSATFWANFGGTSGNLSYDCLTQADMVTLQSDGTWYAESGYHGAASSCFLSAPPFSAGSWTLPVPSNGTAMASFIVGRSGVVAQVAICM
jgi:hypothetical protein